MSALHNEHAEQSVLGAGLLSAEAWEQVQEIITADDFCRQDHRLIFKAMERLSKRGEPLDILTVSDALEASGELKQPGALAYIATLGKETPSAANAATYARIVKDFALRRRLIEAGAKIIDIARNGRDMALEEVIESAEREVLAVADHGQSKTEWADYKTVLNEVIDKVQAAFEREGHVTGQTTGLVDLDQATTGLHPGDLIIIAGRPSMGKSAFAMGIANFVALAGKPVAVFSMEMPKAQLGMRSLASVGRIDLQRIKTGKLDEDEFPRLTTAIGRMAEAPLFVDDTAALTPADLRARCRRLVKEHGQLGLIVVDYLQLMRVPGLEKSRVQEVSEISRSLKALAKEFNVPVIALSQLNRELEKRPNKRPTMADLRESGSIEQDADLILFIYRDEVYNPDSADKGTAEIIIGKQRNGPLATVRTAFLGEYTRFENLCDRAYGEYSGAA